MGRHQWIPTNTPGGTPLWVLWLALGMAGACTLGALLCAAYVWVSAFG